MKKIIISLMALVALASADQLVKLKVTGMMCPACVKNVKGSLEGVKGVKVMQLSKQDMVVQSLNKILLSMISI